ncbi:hypothetical protein SRHO_G00116300 [Serrasalmus rhombeus]
MWFGLVHTAQRYEENEWRLAADGALAPDRPLRQTFHNLMNTTARYKDDAIDNQH